MLRYFRVNPAKYFLVESSHVICSEGGLERYGFVEDTAQRPDVTLAVVRLVPPHFRTGVVRGPSLGVKQSFLGYF